MSKNGKQLDKALQAELAIDKEGLKKMKKKLLKAEGRPDRGTETWYRLTSKNLYSRLQIVDTKANILITANAIIISMVLGTLYSKLEADPHLIFPIGGMVLTNIFSICFAILATIPNAVSSKVRENIDLMTFDDFHNMSLDEYSHSVMGIMESRTTLYPSIIKDIHSLGVALSKKYKLIRISYLGFLYGIIISVILFGMCHMFIQL